MTRPRLKLNASTGRPSKFTPETREKLLTALRVGNWRSVAIAHARISMETFYTWLQQGKQDRAAGVRSPFSEFLDDVEKAEADAEATVVANLMRQTQRSPAAALGLLAVRWRERWGPAAQRVEVSGPGGGPIALSPVLASLPDTVLEERIRRLESEMESEMGGDVGREPG